MGGGATRRAGTWAVGAGGHGARSRAHWVIVRGLERLPCEVLLRSGPSLVALRPDR